MLATRDYTTPQHSIRQANDDVLGWVRDTAGLRTHGTTKQQPLVCFNTVERAALRSLPPTPFQVVVWQEAKLHRDGYVVFAGAYYSAPYPLIGQTLSVRGTPTGVEIQANFKTVAIHSRVPAGQRQTVLAHLPPTQVAGLRLNPVSCLERAAHVGPHTLEVISRWLADRPIDRLPAAHRLLQLAEQQPPDPIERVCARALEFEDTSIRTVFSILRSGIAHPDASPAPAPWPRFARHPEELVLGSGSHADREVCHA